MSKFKTIICTCFSLFAFAGNSVLCRLALGEAQLDPASFTIIRLLSGIVMLMLISSIFQIKNSSKSKGSWFSALMLYVYAVTFSYAYISLDTGTGALILFGSVQLTMVLISLISGNRLRLIEWLGLITAFAGFVYLVIPSISTPSFQGFILMAISGIAWGIYTLMGKTSQQPLKDTAFNFLRTLPFVLALIIIQLNHTNLSQQGIILALISGAITSGIGYSIWYIAVGGLSTIQAGVVQLLVPIIAAIGGVVFAQELISVRLIFSSILVLGGIMLITSSQFYGIKSLE